MQLLYLNAKTLADNNMGVSLGSEQHLMNLAVNYDMYTDVV